MPDYRPRVLPSYGQPLTVALSDAFDAFEQTRRQRREDAQRDRATTDAHQRAATDAISSGWRPGSAPTDDRGATLEIPDMTAAFSTAPPSLTSFAREQASPPAPASPFAVPDNRELAAQLRGIKRPSNPDRPSSPQFTDGRDHADVHPGAFDPALMTFRGTALHREFSAPPAPMTTAGSRPDATGRSPYTRSPVQPFGAAGAPSPVARHVALGPIGRYVEAPGTGGYVDLLQTPDARAEQARLDVQHDAQAARAFDLQLAATLRGEPMEKVDSADGPIYVPRSQAAGRTAAPTATGLKVVEGPGGERTYVRPGDAIGKSAPKSTPALQWGRFMTPAGPRVLQMAEGAAKGYPPVTGSSSGDTAGGGAGGFGAGGIPGAGRALASIESMGGAHDSMKAYETDVMAGRASFDGVDQFKTRLASHFDAHGLVDDAVLSVALADLGKNNPGLANYLQNEYLWSLEDATLAGRPSDFRTKLDAFVSTMKANPTPETMASIWKGRESRLNGYRRIVPALQARLDRIAGPAKGAAAADGASGSAAPPPADASRSTPTTPPPQTQAEYDHLLGLGMTDAQIVSRYGDPAKGIRRKSAVAPPKPTAL